MADGSGRLGGAVAASGLVAVCSLVLAGCGDRADTGVGCDLVYGDLVISEVMPNPDDPCDQFVDQGSCEHPSVDCSWSTSSNSCSGSDTGREWFELYNASAAPRRLDRAVIRRLSEVPAGSDCRTVLVEGTPWCAADHVIRGVGTVPPRSYFVLGDGVVGVAPIDYSYGDNLDNENFGALTATSGGIRLSCRGVEIDTMLWGVPGGAPESVEGQSLGFDGGLVPDALLNDQGELWCAGSEGYDAIGNRGTPGEANRLCGRGACDDGGQTRNVVAPQIGELVLSEIFADPAGADAGKEWLELWVAAASPIDLNGLTVRTVSSGGTTRTYAIDSLSCLSVAPGTFVVVGADADPLVNGGVAVTAVAEGLTLYDGGTLGIERGRAVIDEAQFPAASREGVSTNLNPLLLTAAANDIAANWCPSTTTGLFSGTGTPGAANDLCGDSCWDGPTGRAPVKPLAGELVITEVFPDPSGADNRRDWLEVYVAGARAIDLNGLRIENENLTPTLRTWTLASNDCLTVPAGGYAVLGGANVALDGITPQALLTGGTDTLLFAEPARLSLKSDGAEIDTIQYLDPGESFSYTLDLLPPDAVGNDAAANWCPAALSDQYFVGPPPAYGSPGLANRTTCP